MADVNERLLIRLLVAGVGLLVLPAVTLMVMRARR